MKVKAKVKVRIRFSGLLRAAGTAAAAVLLTGGCGLPRLAVINEPVSISPPANNVIAFRTPSVDRNITGYAIYYKIYAGESDRRSQRDESYWFVSSSTAYSVTEMQPGPDVPNKRGFFRLGVLGRSEIPGIGQPYINHRGPGQTVYIDFTPDRREFGDSGSSSRAEPVIGFGSFPVNPVLRVSRGFIGDPGESGSKTLRSFVNDWQFDLGNPNGYHDADLRRLGYPAPRDNYSVMRYQPGRTIADITAVGAPLFGGRSGTTTTIAPSEILIGLAVHSVGRNVGGGSFSTLYSKPVYLGTVTYEGPVRSNRK